MQVQLDDDKDWSATTRPLHPFAESELPWVSEQRELYGDESSPDYNQFSMEHLKEYPEQLFAYRIISSHAERIFGGNTNETVAALLMILDGAGGCGKSHVLHTAVKEILRLAELHGHKGTPVRVAAPTGAAASLVFGGTLHSFMRWNPARQFAEFAQGSQAESEWQEYCKGLKYLLVDERSLFSQDLFSKLLSRLRQGLPSHRDNPADPTCGVSIILIGDDYQLPPTNGGRMYDEPYYTFQKKKVFSAEREKARRLFLDHFTVCVQLVTNVRAKGSSPVQAEFRALQMECLRPCLPTDEWHKYLKQADLDDPNLVTAAERELWSHKFWLCSTNEQRLKHNVENLAWTSRQLREPIATIIAGHPKGGSVARAGSVKQAQGLLPELMLCVGARVTCSWNGWTSRGIVNGLKGVVVEIVYEKGRGPPSLPLVVFVACSKYRGDSFDEMHGVVPSAREVDVLGFAGFRAGQAGIVAMQPIVRTWEAKSNGKSVVCERQQLPLDLAFAVSIHKGQGTTIGDCEDIPDAVLDIGPTELDLGMTYVGISRFKALSAMKIVYPTWARFENIGAKSRSNPKRATMLARDSEAQRISGLVASTKELHAVWWSECVDAAESYAEMEQSLHHILESQEREAREYLIPAVSVHRLMGVLNGERDDGTPLGVDSEDDDGLLCITQVALRDLLRKSKLGSLSEDGHMFAFAR